MNRTLIMYMVALASSLGGCDSEPIELNQCTDMAEQDRSKMEETKNPESWLPINSCDRRENIGKGFCATNWIDCPEQDHCEIKKYQDYLSMKSISKGTCSCNVGWLVVNGFARLFYSYDRIDGDDIRLIARKTGLTASLVRSGENKGSDVAGFSHIPLSPEGFSMQVVRSCHDCSEQSELRVYFLKVNEVDTRGIETIKKIYEVGPEHN